MVAFGEDVSSVVPARQLPGGAEAIVVQWNLENSSTVQSRKLQYSGISEIVVQWNLGNRKASKLAMVDRKHVGQSMIESISIATLDIATAPRPRQQSGVETCRELWESTLEGLGWGSSMREVELRAHSWR